MVCIAVEYTVSSTAGVSLCRKKRSDVPQSLQTAGVEPECFLQVQIRALLLLLLCGDTKYQTGRIKDGHGRTVALVEIGLMSR